MALTRSTAFDTSWATPQQMAQAQTNYMQGLDPGLLDFMGGSAGLEGSGPIGWNNITATNQFRQMGILPPTAAEQRRASNPAMAAFAQQYSSGAPASPSAGGTGTGPAGRPAIGGGVDRQSIAASMFGGGRNNVAAPAAQPAGPSLTAYTQSPYLQQQLQGLQTQYNNNLTRNVLPQIAGNAMAAGGYGGSRQGIAEGLAAGDSQTGFANAATNLLGADYTNAMNRNLQQYGMDQNFNLGQGNLALGNKNADNSFTLGQGQLALGNRTADQNYALGNLNANNAFTLGQGQLALGNLNANNNYNLGQGNLALGQTQAANQYALGQGNLALGNINANNNYTLGQGNLALGQTQAANQYSLGQGQLANQRYGMDQNYNLGNQNSMQNFYTQNRQLDQSGAQIGANIYNMANNGDWTGLNNANQIFGTYAPNGTATQSASAGGGAMGAAGGALGTYQLGHNFGWW